MARDATRASATARRQSPLPAGVTALLPGLLLVVAVAALGWGLGLLETRLVTYAVIEPLVLAMLAGMALRLVWTPPARVLPGIEFAAKQLLEAAIVLIGASLNLSTLASAGPKLAGAVLASVGFAIVAGTLLGLRSGLAPKLAILVAVGNAICGNSAIVAVAPSIRAEKRDIASAVALTAVLGVDCVLLLPLLVPLLGLSHYQYGVLAGLTVYAVPQVLAATFPVSAESGQIATLVKLSRVLLLGPVVAIFAYLFRNEVNDSAAGVRVKLSLKKLLPWFLVGFLGFALLRTAGVIPDAAGTQAQTISRYLTLIAMAGLGLGVDLQAVRRGSGRVAAVVFTLLSLMIVLDFAMITGLHLGA